MSRTVVQALPGDRTWYTSGEVASLFGVSDRTVVNWANSGFLPHYTTPGGHRRFPAAEVHAFLARRTSASSGSATRAD
jgi:excisionase family DNA binding protein